jgi:TRAP-type uncharacterized transport system substrate-binding protein
MNRTRTLIVAGLLACMSALAQTPEKFQIAGGGGIKTSTYSAMVATIAETCSTDEVQLEEKGTNGGPANLALLKENKVKLAIVPLDLLFAAKLDNASSVAQVKTLFPLHNEQVHVIVRSDVKKEGGYFGGRIGATQVSFNRIEDLQGRPVGAVGGSETTARILGDMLRIGWLPEKVADTSTLLNKLATGQLDAIVISAGAPSAAVAAIDGARFKMLPVRGNSDTVAVYSPAKVEYSNLNGGRSIDTLAAPALLVTRTWKAEETQAKLAGIRACLTANLGKIQDREGTHPAWQDVSAQDSGRWPWYELAAPVKAAPARAKK